MRGWKTISELMQNIPEDHKAEGMKGGKFKIVNREGVRFVPWFREDGHWHGWTQYFEKAPVRGAMIKGADAEYPEDEAQWRVWTAEEEEEEWEKNLNVIRIEDVQPGQVWVGWTLVFLYLSPAEYEEDTILVNIYGDRYSTVVRKKDAVRYLDYYGFQLHDPFSDFEIHSLAHDVEGSVRSVSPTQKDAHEYLKKA
jgi:hypothetical protein